MDSALFETLLKSFDATSMKHENVVDDESNHSVHDAIISLNSGYVLSPL